MRAIVFGIVEAANGYVPDFSKTPVGTQKRINQDPKICILVLVIGIIIYWLWYRGFVS